MHRRFHLRRSRLSLPTKSSPPCECHDGAGKQHQNRRWFRHHRILQVVKQDPGLCVSGPILGRALQPERIESQAAPAARFGRCADVKARGEQFCSTLFAHRLWDTQTWENASASKSIPTRSGRSPFRPTTRSSPAAAPTPPSVSAAPRVNLWSAAMHRRFLLRRSRFSLPHNRCPDGNASLSQFLSRVQS